MSSTESILRWLQADAAPTPPEWRSDHAGISNRVRQRIDLRPLMVHPDAAEMLLLARGQLNRAYRKHGLPPPDPLTTEDVLRFEPDEMDDPAGHGIENATSQFGEMFTKWASAMPKGLVDPVLQILTQAIDVLNRDNAGDASTKLALLIAQDFLEP